MAAIALIVLTQDSITRPAGDAIHDGVTAKSVTVENDTGDTGVTSWLIELVDVPSGPLPGETSALVPGTLASGGATAPLANFTPDVPGTYFVRLTINGIVIDEVAVCVPNDQGWVNPGYNLGGDAFNFAGNTRGWTYFLDRILSYFHANIGGISGSGTDNHITRWDGTGALKDSKWTIENDGDCLIGHSENQYGEYRYIEGESPTTPGWYSDTIVIRAGNSPDYAGGSAGGGGYLKTAAGDGGNATVSGYGGYGGYYYMQSGDGGSANAAFRSGGDGGLFDITGGSGGAGSNGADGGDGADVSIWAGYGGAIAVYGSGDVSGPGGTVYIHGGGGGGKYASPGGHVDIEGGRGGYTASGNPSGEGGWIYIQGGSGGLSGDGDGGSVQVRGGNDNGAGVFGSVFIGDLFTALVEIAGSSTQLSFHGAPGVSKQSVSGAKGGNVALTNLMTALDNLGILNDSTT